MPMGAGIWYNPRTDKVFNFGPYDTHDAWLFKDDNAKDLGLRPDTIDFIKSLKLSDPDTTELVRTAAVGDGMVRVRDYGNIISVQFRARRGLRDLLFDIHKMLRSSFGMYDQVRLNNMATNETVEMSIADMGARLREDTPILFRESQDDMVGDIDPNPVWQKIVEYKISRLRKLKIQAEEVMRICDDLE